MNAGNHHVLTRGMCHRSFLSLLAITIVMGAALCTPTTRADPEAISTFDGGLSEVEVIFRHSTQNTSAAISIPRGATILSAEMDLDGLKRFGDDVRTYDYSESIRRVSTRDADE